MKKIIFILLLIFTLFGFRSVQAEEYDYIYTDAAAIDVNNKIIPDSCGSIVLEQINDDELEVSWYQYTYVDTDGNEYVLNDINTSIHQYLLEYYFVDGEFVSKAIYVINGYFCIRNNITYLEGILDGTYQVLPDMIIKSTEEESVIDDIEYYKFYVLVLNNQFLKNDYKELYIKKTDVDSSYLSEDTLAIRFGQFVKVDFKIAYKTIKVNARGSYSLYPYLVDGDPEYHPYFYLNFVDENGDDIPIDTIVGIKFKYQLYDKTPIFGIKHHKVNYEIIYQSNQVSKSDLDRDLKWYDYIFWSKGSVADYVYLYEEATEIVKINNYDLNPSYDEENVNPDWKYKPIIEKFASAIKIDGVEYTFGITEKTTLLNGRYISEEDFSVIELTYSYNDVIYHYEGEELINPPTIPVDPNPEGEYSILEKFLNFISKIWNWILDHIYIVVIVVGGIVLIKLLPVFISLSNKRIKKRRKR